MDTQIRSRSVILCVDDGETELELSVRKRVLEAAGYRVLTATNGRNALDIFRENRIDLVLTEQLGDSLSNGFTLAAMKRLKPKVPIAIYSADWEASPEHLRFADAFITKLVPVEELLHTIEQLLSESGAAA